MKIQSSSTNNLSTQKSEIPFNKVCDATRNLNNSPFSFLQNNSLQCPASKKHAIHSFNRFKDPTIPEKPGKALKWINNWLGGGEWIYQTDTQHNTTVQESLREFYQQLCLRNNALYKWLIKKDAPLNKKLKPRIWTQILGYRANLYRQYTQGGITLNAYQELRDNIRCYLDDANTMKDVVQNSTQTRIQDFLDNMDITVGDPDPNNAVELKDSVLKTAIQKTMREILESEDGPILLTYPPSPEDKITLTFIPDASKSDINNGNFDAMKNRISVRGLPPDPEKEPENFKRWSADFRIIVNHEGTHRHNIFRHPDSRNPNKKITIGMFLPFDAYNEKLLNSLYKDTFKRLKKLSNGKLTSSQKKFIETHNVDAPSRHEAISKQAYDIFRHYPPYSLQSDGRVPYIFMGTYPTADGYSVLYHPTSLFFPLQENVGDIVGPITRFHNAIQHWNLVLTGGGRSYRNEPADFLVEMSAWITQWGSEFGELFFPELAREQQRLIQKSYLDSLRTLAIPKPSWSCNIL